jgi:hypothetical protein
MMVGRSLICGLSVLLIASTLHAQSPNWSVPCEALNQADTVFTGVAGAPIRRVVTRPGSESSEMTLTPIFVEREYLGTTTATMYVSPRAIEGYAAPGRRYLIYGVSYWPPDIVEASPGYGIKEIDAAEQDGDFTFLETMPWLTIGGTITGVVEYRTDSTTASPRIPLKEIPVQILSDQYAIEARTGPEGRFTVPVPGGFYRVSARLPADLRAGESRVLVRDGGCGAVSIRASRRYSGRVAGMLRGANGAPLPETTVDLIPIDAPSDNVRYLNGQRSVRSGLGGEFEFSDVPSGAYYLGVSLYLAPNPNGPAYPRTYYPGSAEPDGARRIVVREDQPIEGIDFSVPPTLRKGQLEVVVDTPYAGQLTLCFEELEDQIGRWTTESVQAGVVVRKPVVEMQRYRVHAHLKFADGHLESLPFTFVATNGKTVVRLRPDAPRTFHP